MRLLHKVTLAILATLLMVVALVGVLLYASVQRGFTHYVRGVETGHLRTGVERLTALYARERSWDSVVAHPRDFGRMLRPQHGPPPLDGEGLPPPLDAYGQPRGGPGPHAMVDPLDLIPRVTLYDATRQALVGVGSMESDASVLPLVVDGKTVGWLGLRDVKGLHEVLDLQYLAQVQSQLALLALVAIVLGLAAGWLLTRRILRPIDALSAGARRLASGDYSARIGAAGEDELGQLSRDFDALAVTLGEDARARRQWVADTSHELRTPITVLRGEVEALVDGVRPLSVAAMESLHAEILRLGKLVADLEELARSDRGTLQVILTPTDAVEALCETMAAFQGRYEARNLRLTLEDHSGGAGVAGDRLRLQQVFTNLLENTLRYTHDGGELVIQATREGGLLLLSFDDTAPGVPAEALPHLFDRFFRADASRSRAHGGSGLGLSICLRLVEAHHGTLSASASPRGGLRMEVRLPLLANGVPSAAT
jgi:two-component system sensor histidine kinase BaeS